MVRVHAGPQREARNSKGQKIKFQIVWILRFWDLNFKPSEHGGLAQLARAPALQAGGHRFDSDILHREKQSTGSVDWKLKRLKNVRAIERLTCIVVSTRIKFEDEPSEDHYSGEILTKEFIDILVKE